MEKIGLYTQLTEFTTENAGTAEWCMAERDGRKYFVKKFLSPIYPSKDIGLPEKLVKAGIVEFKEAMATKERLYSCLRDCEQSDFLVVPLEVINYQFHICTISEYVKGNVAPEKICLLSEWQRLILMRIFVGVKYYDTAKSGTITLNISKNTVPSRPWPVGVKCKVTVKTGNARSGPGSDYPMAGIVYAGDQFTILDFRMGNTGKDWYKINYNGNTCWISSTLVEVGGHRYGTKNGEPVQ